MKCAELLQIASRRGIVTSTFESGFQQQTTLFNKLTKKQTKVKNLQIKSQSRTKTIVGVVGRNKCHIKGMNHRLDLKATRLLYSDRCQKNICHTFQGQRAHQQLSTTDDCKMEAVFYVCEGGNFGIFQTKSRLMTTLVRPLIRTLRVPGIESKMMTNLRRY